MEMKYKRILLKLSGEALMGHQNHGVDPVRLQEYATEIKEIQKTVYNEHVPFLRLIITGVSPERLFYAEIGQPDNGASPGSFFNDTV